MGKVDLSNCDREMVQLSGAVQPHCALLVMTEPELRIVQASDNSSVLLGLHVETLLGATISAVLGTDEEAELRAKLASDPLPAPVYALRIIRDGQTFQLFAHRVDGVLILEIEKSPDEPPRKLRDLYAELRDKLAVLQDTPTLVDFLGLVVRHIREFTGFERVMAYQFLPDLSGKVVAEATGEERDSYLGLHYPASDIPAPARRLFSLLWLRHLPDVNYTPVKLTPQDNPLTGKPLDLSYVAGRSVSVMYSRYLQNMGVRATMVITLFKEGKVWGLISCMHHSAPRHVPFDVRIACEFLGHMVSFMLAAKEEEENKARIIALREGVARLTKQMSLAEPFYLGLLQNQPEGLSLLQAGGSAVVFGSEIHTCGVCPEVQDIRKIAAWVELKAGEGGIFSTDRLAEEMAEDAEDFKEVASGLMAIRICHTPKGYALWFRPELCQAVHWAGNPAKAVEVDIESGESRLTPRRSFAAWKEEVRGRAIPWSEYEIRIMGELKHSILEVIAKRSEQVFWLNRELRLNNQELDSFAYAAGHDLKEPLRGIHNFSTLVLRKSGEVMGEDSRARMKTIQKLAQRMDHLIESLLHYSRVGRVRLEFEPADLNEVLADTMEMLSPRFEETGTEFRIGRPLPAVVCDAVRVREVFANLISNALKFNDKPMRWVEVGWEESDPVLFWVADNGIGISDDHHEEIFRIFRRLHGRDEWGGGSGAGLTIARRIVERHGGKIWLESKPGEGTRFLFHLAQATGDSALSGEGHH